MKKYFSNALYLSMVCFALTVTSCQKEPNDIAPQQQEGAILADSPIAKLIANTTANDGSFDNIVDGASCFDLSFPYTVEVNGIQITIDSVEDLELIEEIFDAIEDDADLLDIIFPVTVVLSDYTEVVIENKDALRALAEECIEGGNDDDIECIDIVYPITVLSFDTNQVQTASVTVENDKQLRRFFAGLDEEDIVSISYPIDLKTFEGEVITVNSNEELVAAIENAKALCDEDDDDDYNDDDFTKEQLDILLVECPWLVKDVKRNNENQSDQYFEYIMTFIEDEIVTVTDRMGTQFSGTWMTRVSDDGVLLKLTFDTLTDFNLEWTVYEIEEGKIKLFQEDENRIVLRKYCEPNDQCSEANIVGALNECKWAITSFNNEDIYADILIDFTSFNIHAWNPNGVAVDEGNWDISGKVINLNSLSMDLMDINGAWNIIDCGESKMVLKKDTIEMILERVCE